MISLILIVGGLIFPLALAIFIGAVAIPRLAIARSGTRRVRAIWAASEMLNPQMIAVDGAGRHRK
jgi:hypothetical protein